MIRYGVLILCALLMPVMAVADVDNRYYLSESEYLDAPHKYVLKMIDAGRIKCTANLVGGKIITAKHCLTNYTELLDNCSGDNNTYVFQTLDGAEITARVEACGDYKNSIETISGDWAVLTPEVELEYADVCTLEELDEGIVTGYGKLKVLTDSDVTNFVNSYLRFLFDAEKGYPMGTSKNADVDSLAEAVEALDTGVTNVSGGGTMCAGDFLSNASYYDIDVDEWFEDVNPKTRKCTKVECESDECILNCAAWKGDSGAGLWLETVSGSYCFAGVLSRGADDIGGPKSVSQNATSIVWHSKIFGKKQ